MKYICYYYETPQSVRAQQLNVNFLFLTLLSNITNQITYVNQAFILTLYDIFMDALVYFRGPQSY